MKTKILLSSCSCAALSVWLALNASLSSASAQGTAFTYQGQLNINGSLANGTYDFEFDTWSDLSAGSVIGGPVINPAVAVSNGLFLTIIDFGVGVFTGPTNWLHIQVRTNGGGAFSSLSPRQALTPTPYAIYAETANAAGLSGTVPVSNLSGVALLAGGNNFTGNQTVTGTVQVNGPEQITGASGTGFHADENIGPNDYYVGEEHGINFNYAVGGNIGSMLMGYNGQGYFSVGNLYGMGSGTKAFTVFGDGNVNVDPMGMNSGFLNNGNTNGSGLTFGLGSGEGIASKRTAGGNQDGLDFYTSFTDRLSIDNNGNLIIPSDSQTIMFPPTSGVNAPMMEMFSSGTQNADRMVIAHSPYFPTWGLQYQDYQDRFNFLAGGYPVMTVYLGGGTVGIGTTNPTAKLEVNGNVRVDGGSVMLQPAGSGYATDGLAWGDGGLPGINSGTASPFLAGYLGGALGAWSPNTVCLSWDASGDCWVSNNLSTATLSVRNNSTGASEYFYETGSSIMESGEYLGVYGLGGVQPYIGDDGSGNDVQIGSLTHGVTAVACYNATDNAYMHLYCSSITIEGGADLAEPFKITSGPEAIPQGAVVVIDEENPGHLKMSDQGYDTHVAGVVSGANGINPGIQMQQQGLLDGGKNVALTGRVYVQADTSNGIIKPGDLLTTSSTPGHAMKVTDHARAAGAILGKAMTGLSEGNGMVLVLVSLQ